MSGNVYQDQGPKRSIDPITSEYSSSSTTADPRRTDSLDHHISLSSPLRTYESYIRTSSDLLDNVDREPKRSADSTTSKYQSSNTTAFPLRTDSLGHQISSLSPIHTSESYTHKNSGLSGNVYQEPKRPQDPTTGEFVSSDEEGLDAKDTGPSIDPAILIQLPPSLQGDLIAAHNKKMKAFFSRAKGGRSGKKAKTLSDENSQLHNVNASTNVNDHTRLPVASLEGNTAPNVIGSASSSTAVNDSKVGPGELAEMVALRTERDEERSKRIALEHSKSDLLSRMRNMTAERSLRSNPVSDIERAYARGLKDGAAGTPGASLVTGQGGAAVPKKAAAPKGAKAWSTARGYLENY